MTIFTITNITAFIDTAANAISVITAAVATVRATTAIARRFRNRNANRRTRRANAARNRTNRTRRNRHKSRGTAPPRSRLVARPSTRVGRLFLDDVECGRNEGPWTGILRRSRRLHVSTRPGAGVGWEGCPILGARKAGSPRKG